MSQQSQKVLLYGYGNPGRQDDALGILLCEELEKWAVEKEINYIEFDSNYQLNIEDSKRISDFDLVIFADATVREIDSFHWSEITPNLQVDFSMHSVTPSFVVGLCNMAFEKFPKAMQLEIKGFEWEFMSSLSERADLNLNNALDFIKDYFLHLQD